MMNVGTDTPNAPSPLDLLQGRIAALEAENAELRKDAARYRWLRDENSALEKVHPALLVIPHDADLDAAIDAAMEGK